MIMYCSSFLISFSCFSSQTPLSCSHSQSDGSTETLSVAAMEETRGPNDSSSLETDPGGSLGESSVSGPEAPSPLPARLQQGPQPMGADPQCRSLSMDSAYGTLSPESLLRELELRGRRGQSEGEETEGEEAEPEGEAREEEEEPAEGEAASEATRCRDSHVPKIRRCPPVQPRLRCLQSAVHKSRSEDNLLQRLQGPSPTQQALVPEGRAEGLAHSKSLSNLYRRSFGKHKFQAHAGLPDDYSGDPSASGDPVKEPTDALRRGEVQRTQGAQSGAGKSSASDGGVAPSVVPEGNCEPLDGEEVCSAETEGTRKSPEQQHKKLTLAQLYRIRTSMVLNSTLTAS